MRLLQRLLVLVLAMFVSSCYWMTKRELDQQYGEQQAIQRINIEADAGLYQEARSVIENRCVVCHACYDAPCQLKLSSIEGMDRGANKTPIYDGYRLLANTSTQFFEDGHGHDEWRKQEFFPILNERGQSPENNLSLSVIYQMLQLKNDNPLPQNDILPDSFDLDINRKQYCPRIEEMEDFRKRHALWGMPYGLPAISDREFSILEDWIAQGAQVPERPPVVPAHQARIDEWEAFFNGVTMKEQLVSRYIYEHLYLANLYFPEVDENSFFRIVRSFTPPGQPVRVMPTLRPYDPPAARDFYYRLIPVNASIVAKTHMPYALDKKRYDLWTQLFFEVDYEVKALPSYQLEIASNPFVVYEAIPMRSRYRFLLEEAQFSIMNFIKGPVCRGKVALNVINDHFWVAFANPDLPSLNYEEEFLRANKQLLRFPAYWESNGRPWGWIDLANRQEDYIEAKSAFMNRFYSELVPVDMNAIWDGDGHNPNAALTILRHADSATVLKGFAGNNPQTAWIIDYPLLERIHYLLVAGFDVNGNVVHQLMTRLYMDFLRMEGEANFLALLPQQVRQQVWQDWYADAPADVAKFFGVLLDSLEAESVIPYRTDSPKDELLDLLMSRTNALRYTLDPDNYSDVDIHPLAGINGSVGLNISFLAQSSIVEVSARGQSYWFSFTHHNVYQNKTRLLTENALREPEKDSLLVAAGIVSPYPNALFHVEAQDLPAFVQAIGRLASESDYRRLKDVYGIRRTNPGFWQYSDRMHAHYRQSAGLEYGLLDFNRLENR